MEARSRLMEPLREPLFPAARAFIVQFTRDCDADNGLHGRVEHVATGRSCRFATAEDFLAFVQTTMDASAADADAEVTP